MTIPKIKLHDGDLPHPITALEGYFHTGGVTLIQAAFAHSYFINPDSVRKKNVYSSDRARLGRKHYRGRERGDTVIRDDGRSVVLGDNRGAQTAWSGYSGRALARGTGYSVRHIWGEPWNPDAFTAGWNLCYMPFWAGMLTEQQHSHEELKQAIRQASWDLYFGNNPVCNPPAFVADPGLDLRSLLGDQPILILHMSTRTRYQGTKQAASEGETRERVREIRSQTHQSWSKIFKAARDLQSLDYEPFGSPNAKSAARSCVRRIQKETGLTLSEIESLSSEQPPDNPLQWK